MWKDRTAYRKYNAATHKAKYVSDKAAGKCPHCGDRDPYPGMVSCLECRARHRRYARLFRMRQREMKRQGIVNPRCLCRKRAMIVCETCRSPVCDTCYDVGEGQCQACLERRYLAAAALP